MNSQDSEVGTTRYTPAVVVLCHETPCSISKESALTQHLGKITQINFMHRTLPAMLRNHAIWLLLHISCGIASFYWQVVVGCKDISSCVCLGGKPARSLSYRMMPLERLSTVCCVTTKHAGGVALPKLFQPLDCPLVQDWNRLLLCLMSESLNLHKPPLKPHSGWGL